MQYEPVCLLDIRVNPDRKMRTDDALYAQDAELRERVARGNCFVRFNAASTRLDEPMLDASSRSDKSVLECVVQALRKFTGGLGDDDDVTDQVTTQKDVLAEEELAWKRFFLKPLDEAAQFVSMEKVGNESFFIDLNYF